jgi:hypothetical protein
MSSLLTRSRERSDLCAGELRLSGRGWSIVMRGGACSIHVRRLISAISRCVLRALYRVKIHQFIFRVIQTNRATAAAACSRLLLLLLLLLLLTDGAFACIATTERCGRFFEHKDRTAQALTKTRVFASHVCPALSARPIRCAMNGNGLLAMLNQLHGFF